ncbi:hypothetical protein EBR25_14320, partial [bacterium]|nr:hypothetical protein [bacterium]
YTNDAEARYEKAGLTLVTSFFQVEMEQWQRRTFLKRLRVCLQEIGFKPSKVSKLITAGEFMAVAMKQIEGMTNEWCSSTEELAKEKGEQLVYLQSYGVSGLYQLARMNWKGQAQARNSYAAADGKPLTVRELERLQSKYPAEISGSRSRKTKLQDERVDGGQTKELVSTLVNTVKAIDWSSIHDDPEAMDLLSTVELRLDHMAELVEKWKYSPLTITSRYEQLEMGLNQDAE